MEHEQEDEPSIFDKKVCGIRLGTILTIVIVVPLGVFLYTRMGVVPYPS